MDRWRDGQMVRRRRRSRQTDRAGERQRDRERISASGR
jgi:hypothetical protein